MAVLHSLADLRSEEGISFVLSAKALTIMPWINRDDRKTGDVDIFSEVDELGKSDGRSLACDLASYL